MPGSNNASAGLLAWFGTGPGAGEFYKDDDARALLAAIGTSGALGTDKWVTTIATAILANLRITGSPWRRHTTPLCPLTDMAWCRC